MPFRQEIKKSNGGETADRKEDPRSTQPIETVQKNRRTFANLLFGDRERWRNAESRIAKEEPVAQDSLLPKQLHDPIELLGITQFDRQQQPHTANFPHKRMSRQQLFVERALPFGLCRKIVLQQVFESRQTGRTTNRMSPERRNMAESRIVSELSHALRRGDESAQRHPATKRLGHTKNIGFDPVFLESEKGSRTTEPGLYLIENEQGSRFVTPVAQRLKESFGRKPDSRLPLHRLDQDTSRALRDERKILEPVETNGSRLR